MNGGVKQLLVMASFAAAGCAAAPDQVEVRPIGGAGAKLRAADDPLAAAKGQFAIGNVGLALEGFRKAARENPNSAEALAGMAACYETMGRDDLAEAKYEAALALAPRNATLLSSLAGVLERLGRSNAAAEARSEVALLNSAAAALDQTSASEEPAPVAAPAAPAQTIVVALPPPQLAAPAAVAVRDGRRVERLRAAELAASEIAIRSDPPAAERVTVKLPAARLADRAGISLAATPLAVRAGGLDQQVRMAVDLSRDIPAPRLGARVGVSLGAVPLPMRGASLDRQAPVNLDLTSDIPAPRLGEPTAVAVLADHAPRLERLSLGEVALLTGGGPVWRGQVVARTPQKLTVRWVPLATAATRPSIRLLNAARWQGLAARSRSYLFDRGWRRIEIGDARQARDESLVLYPAAHAVIGRRLAAQFGCRSRPVQGGEVFLVLLGRDSRLRPAPLRG
jgi:tetratricopeptide (TPR) repeat protein